MPRQFDTTYNEIADNALPETVRERGKVLEVSSKTAVQDHVKELGIFGASDIVWEK